MSHQPTQDPLSRRQFLSWSMIGSGALLLAACGSAQSTPSAVPATLAPTATPPPAEPTATAVAAAADGEVTVLVADVLDYSLESQDWTGPYGSVTFRLHEARHNGEAVYHIRTDASDPAFAEEVGLVFVPLLNVAQGIENVNKYYSFSDDRPPVIAMIPGDEHYSSLFHMIDVTVGDADAVLDSAEAILQAEADGDVTLEERLLYVNYPLIQWPGGGLSVDPELDDVLSGGQLFAAPDLENMAVTMKLHQCYPGSRYILTDTSSDPMAPMMNIPASVPTQQLKERRRR